MSKRNGNGSLRLYKSYMFRGKDPVIDELRTKIQDTYKGKLDGKVLREISEEGGPTVGCMRAWFYGVTRRPTSATIEAAGRALGFKRIWVRHND
jgi:hypothetical protein